MLKVNNVTKFYDDFKAVDNLSFTVKKGEIFGLLGVNGAGKTTTFRMIIGLLKPSNGEITFDGKPIDYNLTDSIGFLTEERSLLTKMTVRQQCHYYGVLKGLSEKQVDERLEVLLNKFNISSYRDKKIKELSKGNQQKIQFITAIINDPKLLILDEPFAGLDPLNVELFKKQIKEMAARGSIIIFSSHRMEHVELFCEKIIVLKDGKTVLSGVLSHIKKKYRKMNIRVKGSIDVQAIKKIEGVISVDKVGDEYKIRIMDESVSFSVFELVKECDDVTEYVLEEPSLNEIFIDKVGETYE